MPIGYSVQYASLYVAPGAPLYASTTFGNIYCLPFSFTNGGLTAIGDLVYLVKVPPICEILLFESLLRFAAWDTSTTVDIGWLAYTEPDGDAVAADDNGLLDGLDVDAAGWWYAGVHHSSTDTTVAAAATADIYSVRAREAVTLTAVFRDAAPTDTDTFSGYFKVLIP